MNANQETMKAMGKAVDATKQPDKYAHARRSAKVWLQSIQDMLDAPYEKCAEAAGWEPYTDKFGVACWRAKDDGATWAGTAQSLCEAHDLEPDDDTRDGARTTITESVLSVQVRSGWHSPGYESDHGEMGTPEEYEILLSTGGPALRILGRLNQHCEPESAELQMQDWGIPWERYPAPEATLLAFASHFWFGE